MFSSDLMRQMEDAMPKASYPSINRDDIESLSIPIPDISTQNNIIKQVKSSENAIRNAQLILNDVPSRKKEVMERYLL